MSSIIALPSAGVLLTSDLVRANYDSGNYNDYSITQLQAYIDGNSSPFIDGSTVMGAWPVSGKIFFATALHIKDFVNEDPSPVTDDKLFLILRQGSPLKSTGLLLRQALGAQVQLATPTGLTPTVVSDIQINLVWNSVVNATSYVITAALDAGFTTGVRTVFIGSATNCSDTGGIGGTTYFYRCQATADGFVPSAFATTSATTAAPSTASQLRSLTIHYNNTDFAYNTVDYPSTMRVISDTTIVADTVNNQLNANTGIAYNRATNRLICATVRSQTADFILDRQRNNLGMISWLSQQGIAVDSANNRYFVLNAAYVDVRTSSNVLLNRLVFPLTQPNPGMIFYDEDNDEIWCSYDINDVVYGWSIDWGSSTLTNIYAITINGAQEGVARDYISGNIIVNILGGIREVDITGTIIRTLPVPGTSGNALGTVNEGLCIDPTDGTVWVNKDRYYHGQTPNGNKLFHIDFNASYDKYVYFARMFAWNKGLLDSDLEIIGNYEKSILRVKSGSTSGKWISPIIDFGAFTMQQNISNIILSDSAAIRFRGAATAPSTTADNQFARPFWDANQSNQGWGATSPDAFSPTPSTRRYVQVEAELIN